jgi:hypothetical protein
MSSTHTHKDRLLKFYTYQKTGKFSQHNLQGANTPQNVNKDCSNVYVSNNPHGYYLDLNAKPIGGRPVWKPYNVGDVTHVSGPRPQNELKDYGCRGPYWCTNCK